MIINNMDLYPLKFKSIFKKKIWGGRNMENILDKDLPEGQIGESWEVSDHLEDTTIVSNGNLRDKSLHDILEEYEETLVGKKAFENYPDKFPLLYKFIDAKDKLSVQVHPDDEYAKNNENNELGKTEMWIILHTDREDSFLIAGLKKNTTKEKFNELLESGDLEQCLHKIPVKTGDVIFIPSRRIHAIMPGIVLCEIQQNSDTTYRVFDWNRVGFDGKPRPLHVKQSLDVIDFNDWEPEKAMSTIIEDSENKIEMLVSCNYFETLRYNLKTDYKIKKSNESFTVLNVLSGRGEILYNNNSISFNKGESILIPAIIENPELKIEKESTIIYSKMP